MEEFLRKEWRFNNLTKYQHLFDEWFKNLTPNQILYYEAYARGAKTPYAI